MQGEGVTPGLRFSFSKHEFGACFIHRAGIPAPTAVLRLTNTDSRDIRSDRVWGSLYDRLQHAHKYCFLREKTWALSLLEQKVQSDSLRSNSFTGHFSFRKNTAHAVSEMPR